MTTGTLPAKSLMTVDEFWDFVHRPENVDRSFELRRGEVVEMSRPRNPHCAATANLTRLLGNYSFDVGSGYVLSNDSGLVLAHEPGTVVGPDVAYFRETLKYDELNPKWGEIPPVLAIEVLSPNDRHALVNEKIEDYLQGGVKIVWLVDPEDKIVTVYRPDQSLKVMKRSDELTGGTDLPGLSLKVADIFRLPGDRPQPTQSPAG